jgi:hypothetical protein
MTAPVRGLARLTRSIRALARSRARGRPPLPKGREAMPEGVRHSLGAVSQRGLGAMKAARLSSQMALRAPFPLVWETDWTVPTR